MATYTEKELEQIIPKYQFNNIDFSKLDELDIYLVKVEVEDMSADTVSNFCRHLKNSLADKGIDKVIIIPIRNGIPKVDFYKLEKDIKND